MSVTKVIPDLLGSGSADQTKQDGRKETVYHRTIGVLTSDYRDGPVTVLAACGVNFGDAYTSGRDGDSGSVCRKRAPSRDSENPKFWRVELEYGPLPIDSSGGDPGGGGGEGEYPVIEVRVGHFDKTKVCQKDIFGTLVADSAGMPYSPLPEVESFGFTVTVRRYEPDAGKIGIGPYMKAINTDQFMGVEAFHAQLYSAAATRRFTDQGIVYWEVEYEFHFDPEGYLVEILDAGQYVQKGRPGSSASSGSLPSPGDLVNKTVERITDYVGIPINNPVPLDGQGGIARWQNPPKGTYKTWHLRREIAFSALQMPRLVIAL